MIISLCGAINSGKDTVATYLIEQHNFKKMSFAGSLKDAVSKIFNWDRDLLEGSTDESRTWRETTDEWWATKLEIPNLTPRWVLQYLGTNTLRTHFNPNIWIASLENKLRFELLTSDVIITDCRFKNELNLINDMGGFAIKVTRGDDPDWIQLAKLAYIDDYAAIRELEKQNIHASEYSWCGYEFKHIITNDSTLKSLYKNTAKLIATF